MATPSSILAWRIPMDRGAWQVTVHGVRKESDTTEHRSAPWSRTCASQRARRTAVSTLGEPRRWPRADLGIPSGFGRGLIVELAAFHSPAMALELGVKQGQRVRFF